MIYFKRYNKNGETREIEITKEEYESYSLKKFNVDDVKVTLSYAPITAEDYEELYFGKGYLEAAQDISKLNEKYLGLFNSNGLLDKNGILYRCPMFNHHELYKYLPLKNIDVEGILRVNIGASFDNYYNISSYTYRGVELSTKQAIAIHNIISQGCRSTVEDFIYEKKLYGMGFQKDEDIKLAKENVCVLKRALGSQFNLPNSYFVFGRDIPIGEELS